MAKATGKKRPRPEVKRSVLDAMREELRRSDEHATERKEHLDLLERGFLKARKDQPQHRALERELWLAYISRLKRYLFPLQAKEAEVQQQTQGVQLTRELDELYTWIYGENPFAAMKEQVDALWDDRFWTTLLQRGVRLKDAIDVMSSHIPPPKGRPPKMRVLAVKALQLKLGEKWPLPKITSQVCNCGEPSHTSRCRETIRQAMLALKKVLEKYDIRPENFYTNQL